MKLPIGKILCREREKKELERPNSGAKWNSPLKYNRALRTGAFRAETIQERVQIDCSIIRIAGLGGVSRLFRRACVSGWGATAAG